MRRHPLAVLLVIGVIGTIVGTAILLALPDKPDDAPTPTTWHSGDGDTVRVLP